MMKLLKAAALTVFLGGVAAYILVSRFAPGDTPEKKVEYTQKELENLRRTLSAALPKTAPGGDGSGISTILNPQAGGVASPGGVIEATLETRAPEAKAPPAAPAPAAPAAAPQASPAQPAPRLENDLAVENAAATVAGGPVVREHVVAPGETLNLIAQKYLGSANAWKRIADANPGVNPDRLSIGTKLRIPVEDSESSGPAAAAQVRAAPQATAVQAETGPRRYKVEAGDTLCRIASKFLGSSNRYREIIEMNPGLEPDRLFVGQELKVPGK